MIKYEKLKFLKKSFNKSYTKLFLMTENSKTTTPNLFVEKSKISDSPVIWDSNKRPYAKQVRRPLFTSSGFVINKLLLVFWYGDASRGKAPRLYLRGLKHRHISTSTTNETTVLNTMTRGELLGYSNVPKVLGNSYVVRIPTRADFGAFWRNEKARYSPLGVEHTEKKDLLRPSFFREANSYDLTTCKTQEAQAYQNNVHLYQSKSITFSNIKNRNQKSNPISNASNSYVLERERFILDLRRGSKGPLFFTTANSEYTLPAQCKGVGKDQQGFIKARSAVTKYFSKAFSYKRQHTACDTWDFKQCFIKKSSCLKKLTNTHFGLKLHQCYKITKQSFTPWRLANVLTVKWRGFNNTFNNTKGVLNINSKLLLSYRQNTTFYDLERSLGAKNYTMLRQRAVSVDDYSPTLKIKTLGYDISYLLKKSIKKCRSLPYSILIIYLNRFLIFFYFFSKVISNKTANIYLLNLFTDFHGGPRQSRGQQRSLAVNTRSVLTYPWFVPSKKISKIKIRGALPREASTTQIQKLSMLIKPLLKPEQLELSNYFLTLFDSSTGFLLKTAFFQYLTFGSSTNIPGYLLWQPLSSTAKDPGTTRVKKGLKKTKEVGTSGKSNVPVTPKGDVIKKKLTKTLSFVRANLCSATRCACCRGLYRFSNTKVSVAQVIQYVEDYERCSVFPLSGNTEKRPSFSPVAEGQQTIITSTASVLWQYNKKNQNKNSLVSVFKKFWLTLPIDYFYIKIKKVGNIVENSGKKAAIRPYSRFFTTFISQSLQGYVKARSALTPSTTGRTLLSRKWFLTNGRHVIRVDINRQKPSDFQKMKLSPDYFLSQYSLRCFFSLPVIRFKQEILMAQCLAERNYSKNERTLCYNVVPLSARTLTGVYSGCYNTPVAYELIQTLREFTQQSLFKRQGHILILTKSSIAKLHQSESLSWTKIDSLSFLKTYGPQSTTTKSPKEIINENSTIKDLWLQTKIKRSLFFKNVIKKRFTQTLIYSNIKIDEHSTLNWTNATFCGKSYFVNAQSTLTKGVFSENKTTPRDAFFLKKTEKTMPNMGISLAWNKARPRQQRALHKWVVMFVLSKHCAKQEHDTSCFASQNNAYGGQKRPGFKIKKIHQCFYFLTKQSRASRSPRCLITINWQHVSAHNLATATHKVYLSKDNFLVKEFLKGQLGFCSRIVHMYGGLFLKLFRFKKHMLRQHAERVDVDTSPASYLGRFLRRKNLQLSYKAMLTPKPCRRYCYSTNKLTCTLYENFTKKRSFVTDFRIDKSNFTRIFNDNIALKTTENDNKIIKAFNNKTKNHKTKFSVYTYFFF